MKYILMMHTPYGDGTYGIWSWAPEDVEAHMAFMGEPDRSLDERGELVGGEGLTDPGEAKLVRAGRNGEPVTDGPLAETQEFLAGYWIVDVDSPDRAWAIAARASAAPGPGAAPLNTRIEVRGVMESALPAREGA